MSIWLDIVQLSVLECVIVCNFRVKLSKHDVFRVIKLLLYSVPEHRKKVKKFLHYMQNAHTDAIVVYLVRPECFAPTRFAVHSPGKWA